MSPDSRLKARVKFLKGQLSVGQTLYFAPWDAYEMKEDEIRLGPGHSKNNPASNRSRSKSSTSPSLAGR